MTQATVKLWGTDIGYVHLSKDRQFADFEYRPDFLRSGIEVAPVRMPLASRLYRFPELSFRSFHGLPGLLADSLTDKFGNAVIDTWLATRGRKPESFNAVERLCYIGTRGMGALEFQPVIVKQVQSVVSRWCDYADEVGVHSYQRDKIQPTLRLSKFR